LLKQLTKPRALLALTTVISVNTALLIPKLFASKKVAHLLTTGQVVDLAQLVVLVTVMYATWIAVQMSSVQPVVQTM